MNPIPPSSRDGLWLITAGAFVGQELAAEFGQMPPCFLPVGTRRLYEYQLEAIGQARPVYLTLPESYDIPADDRLRLDALGAIVLSVPEGLSLGESIVFALNLIAGADQPIWILHGDTLIDGMAALPPDSIGIASSAEGYSWAEVALEGTRVVGLQTVPAGGSEARGRPIACGFFAFTRSAALIRGITRARGGFIAGILDYAAEHPLQAVEVAGWHDFGHVQTFFRSRRLVASARHFNTLRIDGRTARKTSADRDKIRAETAWLGSVPPGLSIYAARLIDAGEDADGQAFYETEYGYLPTLAELFVFGALGPPAWSQILRSCGDFLTACAACTGTAPAGPLLRELAVGKTETRLCQFAAQTGFDVTGMLRYAGRPLPSLMQIAADLAGRIDFAGSRPAQAMHGDFCFSNILYDSRMQRIRVIDPRGYVAAGQPSIMGDLRYDLAKLAHSVTGRYDQIIAGRFRLDPPNGRSFGIAFPEAPHQAWLDDALATFGVDGIGAGGPEVRALTVLLFLSMLPLHADRPDRQRAFVANALRLYAGLEAESA